MILPTFGEKEKKIHNASTKGRQTGGRNLTTYTLLIASRTGTEEAWVDRVDIWR